MSYGHLYLFFAAIGLGVSYFLLSFIFSKFFSQPLANGRLKKLKPILIVVILSLIISAISHEMPVGPDNRFLHALGGGFMVVLVCFLAIKNLQFGISKFQFIVVSALTATAFGVANELLEFFLENYFGLVSNVSLNDTWLDLASNTVGILVALFILTPLYKQEKQEVGAKM